MAGSIVRLRLQARRFRCDVAGCRRRVFTERFDPDVLAPWARRTNRLDELVHHLAIALGGRPASRLAQRLMLPVSKDTLLRAVRWRGGPRLVPPTVVGIDDWAWRRNQRYGTIICDLERRRTIALLPDREPATARAWFAGQPQIAVVAYQRAPDRRRRRELRMRFDRIFRRRTGFATLDRLLARLHANKEKLLVVLDRPEVPLHTNGSERDLRPHVVKRKLSGGTRSETGRACRDAFLGLLLTCGKLGVSFWGYLGHRLGVLGAQAPDLPDLVRLRLAPALLRGGFAVKCARVDWHLKRLGGGWRAARGRLRWGCGSRGSVAASH